MAKLDFKSDIFKTSHKSIFYNFFLYFFFHIFIYIYKNVLSAKYYQENKEKLQKKLMKYQNLSNKEKEKMTIWSWTLQKSFRRWKKNLLSIDIIEWEKTLYYNYKKVFYLENFASL